jgi:signal transduction histidine kinase
VPFLGDRTLRALDQASVIAGGVAILAAIAMFIRWRLEGRAQSWWLALAYFVIGTPALVVTSGFDAQRFVALGGLGVALVFFAAASRSPQVDSILSVRLAVVTGAAAFVAVAVVTWAGNTWPASGRVASVLVGLVFAALAVLWLGSHQDKPWFVGPLVGYALCCIAFASAPERARVAEIGCLLLVVNGLVAATVMRGLQAAASRHRMLALDAQRERDLVASMREELEARYADTLHEVRSIVLALEGGMRVFRPATGSAGSETLTESLVAELGRLRALADPDKAALPADFTLADALDHLLGLSRANGWPVRWDFPPTLAVRGRPADVAQIVHALLTNARKYAPDGAVEVSALDAGAFVLVLVDDYGPGVKPADRERIFERGMRTGNETEEGHGFGLYIARGLARALGGELWVEQHPRGGARFVLALRKSIQPSVVADLRRTRTAS